MHSCSRLIIKNDTFLGIEIIDRLQLINIDHIQIESYAFRGLRKSPKQFLIQDSHLDYIPLHAFTGIFNVDHFWFRNVSIKRIAKMAFSKLYKINYLYFRNTNIDIMEPGAFGKLYIF